MASRPRSFRRNLLLKILAFSMPILLIGQAVALRKARTSLLKTARQNLTNSAVRKTEELETGIQSVAADIDLIAQTEALRSGDPKRIEQVIANFAQDTPYTISCVELTAPQAETATVNTCDRSIVPSAKQAPWLQSGGIEQPDFYVFSPSLDPAISLPSTDTKVVAARTANRALVKFIVASPIYDQSNQLLYTLAMEVYIAQQQDINDLSLVGETVVIDPNNIVITHPDPAQVGKNISQLREAQKLNSIVGSVKSGRSSFAHLFQFLPEDNEWLAGYSGFKVPVNPKQNNVWTVLTVTPIDNALSGLDEIRNVLFVLTIGLLIASTLLALYVARSLSLPVEHLIRYTQDVDDLAHLKRAPHSSHIWELDYLGTVIERMLKRLGENSAELRRAWQDAQMANQLKNEFLANTSHELRTPLNGIIGSIGVIRDGLCDSREEELEFLQQADKAAFHLLSVIEDILNIAKIEAGTLNVKIAPVDLQQLLRDVLDIQAAQIQQKGLQLIRPELSEPLMIPVDHSRFKQVLLNVLSNAIKFTDQGAIAITVTTDESAREATNNKPNQAIIEAPTPQADLFMPPGPWVKITVQDSGIGIDPKHLSKLFKPFVMVDGSHTRAYEGTGLGLAISQNFMQLMQGDISLYSEGKGKGVTVTIVAPRLVPQFADSDDSASETDSKLYATAVEAPEQNGRSDQHLPLPVSLTRKKP